MESLAYGETLFNRSIEAACDYVSDFMKHLTTDTRYTRGPDGKYHHYQVPCGRLQVYVTCHMPRDVAGDVTLRIIRRVSVCYTNLIKDGRFRSACEEIAPRVIKAVIHPSVKCLDFIRDNWHPTLLDYYKDVSGDIMYRALPLLRDRDIETLANKCKRIRFLSLGGKRINRSSILNLISRFECLEELNLSLLRPLSGDELKEILCWLVGIVPSQKLSAENTGDIPTCTGASSQANDEALVEEFRRKHPAGRSEQLKSFGCTDARFEHINLICKFCNLTSLFLCDVVPSCSLTPLKYLNQLKNFALVRYLFSNAEELLTALGSQLTCLKLVDVFGTKLTFLSQNCRSVKCLHLFFSQPVFLILPDNYRGVYSYLLPVPDFSFVRNFQVYITERLARRYILSRFVNVRKLSVVLTGDDTFLLDFLIHRTRLTRLEELYWGCDTLAVFSERGPNIYKFVTVAGATLQRIVK
ncbi:hypothetical protein Cfor_05619 [Coptotermes formosanus]|uniref:Uncharacterized protein n=1 Tax=Coptotermes formosanus TaxID=36987 RepID=A0A6L2PX77_COPFO|nr:hypothetical protein Cfor_05619 [Coptotermes formosanus]